MKDDAFLSAGLFKLLCPISYSCMSRKHGGSGMFHQIIMSIGCKVLIRLTGASLSEHHTSDVNAGSSSILSIVHRSVHADNK